jgi:anti-sigma B factor antagonist
MAIAETARALVVTDLGGRTSSADEPTVVWLRGEHDLSTIHALSDALSRAIAVDDRDLVVDLSNVEFMGAATIGVLVRARLDVQARGRTLTLRAPSRVASRVLGLCGVDLVESP